MTTTPRLNLGLIDPLSLIDPVTQINAQFSTIDTGGNGAFVCTSTTRPASPYNGMLVFETDTKRVWVRDNGTGEWLWVGGGKDPYAFEVNRIAALNLAASGDTDINYDTVTVAPAVGSHTGTIWTCGKTGYYYTTCYLAFTSNNTFQVNGVNLYKSTTAGGSTYGLLKGGDYKITNVSSGNYPITLQLNTRFLATTGFNYKIAHTQQVGANGCALIAGLVYSYWVMKFEAES